MLAAALVAGDPHLLGAGLAPELAEAVSFGGAGAGNHE
jgi:hypothetical protein